MNRGQRALPGLANREPTTTIDPLAYQALGIRSNNLVKPGWWVGTKFRYMFCYMSCRTIPLSPHTKWEHIQPHFPQPCREFFQKYRFQHGGIAMLNHAERVWELDTQNQRPNHRVMFLRARYIHTSPLTRIESFCNSVDYLSVILTPQSFVYFQRDACHYYGVWC